MAEVLHVAIVGGSETARQLITDFLSRPFVKVVGVSDTDENSPRARAATRAGIPFTTAVSELGELDPRPDLVIDVCRRPSAGSELDQTFPASAPEGPTVVHDVVAQLVLKLAADSYIVAPSCDSTLPPALQM